MGKSFRPRLNLQRFKVSFYCTEMFRGRSAQSFVCTVCGQLWICTLDECLSLLPKCLCYVYVVLSTNFKFVKRPRASVAMVLHRIYLAPCLSFLGGFAFSGPRPIAPCIFVV